MTKPVVLHIRGSDFYGSPERLIIGQMQNMSDFRSMAASFIKPGQANQFLERLAGLGLDHFPIEDRLKFDWRIPKQLRAICHAQKVDLIVTHEYKSAVYGYLARRKLPIPQVCYFHGWTQENARVKLYNALDRLILRRADRIVTVSEATAQRLVKHRIPLSKIDIVYNAVELRPDTVPPERTPNAIPVIGVIGRLSYEKGVHDFLKALAQIRSGVKPFAARIYGSGPEEIRLRKMSEDFKLTDCVSFEGFRSDIERIYDELDFLVLPSLSEGHPVVILEAWKHGLGIIATRAGGIPEVIEHDKTGLLTDIGRPDQLATAMRRALEDISFMNRLGRTGFEKVRTTYNYRKQAELLDAIYRAVLQRKSETTS